MTHDEHRAESYVHMAVALIESGGAYENSRVEDVVQEILDAVKVAMQGIKTFAVEPTLQ